MAESDLSSLYGVALGGAIGFVAAIGVEELKRWRDKVAARERTSRLLDALYEEIEQIAELLAIDLGVAESPDVDFLLNFGRGDAEYDGSIAGTISRISQHATIYEANADRLLDLPGYLPNQLVRFHTRLNVNCERMLAAIRAGDLPELLKLREVSLGEAEVLKTDLKRARDA